MAIIWLQSNQCHYNWSQSGFKTIEDVWDVATNNWKEIPVIYNRLSSKTNWISEFRRIKDYLPPIWKEILKGNILVIDNDLDKVTSTRSLKIDHSAIRTGDKTIEYQKVKQRDLYYKFLYPISIPDCLSKWNESVRADLSLEELFKEKCHFIYNKKSYDFHWKLLHRSVYSEMRLKLMNKSDGVCKMCNISNETLIHLI